MAYYSDELINEAIVQNDIVEVISEYVNLKKRGRNFIGLCPFHREKTPSFCVSMDRQIFKCFGCSEGGNVITFIMKIEKFEFWQSVIFLAERAHIDVEKYEVKTSYVKENSAEKTLKDNLYNLHKDVALYYFEALKENLKQSDNVVKKYIEKRKLNLKVLTNFGIGYGRGKVPLYEYLTSKGYTQNEILASGIITKTDNGRLYDRFKGRLIFPIFDVRGRVIAFGGRVLDNSLPKYVNSPESVIYSKSQHLYALNFAKTEKLDSIIIVEGYMDAISLHQNGIKNVVASLGTALTEQQARLLKKYTDTVIIGYDQDGAGQDATLRGMDILVSKKINVKVLILDKDDVKDPDEYINKYGEAKFKKCIDSSITLVEFKILQLEKNLDINNIDSKIKFLTQIANILAKIENNIEREIYIDKISDKYKIGKGPILNEISKKLNNEDSNSKYIDTTLIEKKINYSSDIKKRQEQYIVALLISKDKNVKEQILSKISSDMFEVKEIKNVFEKLLQFINTENIGDVDIISKIHDEGILKELAEIMYIDVDNVDKQKLLAEILRNKKKSFFLKRREEILKRIGQNISKDEQEVLQFELNQIILELSKLKSK